MIAVILCKKMKWTFQEYEEQPEWFITALLISENEKAIERNRQIKRR